MKPRVLFIASSTAHERILQDIDDIQIEYFPIPQQPRYNKKAKNLTQYVNKLFSLVEFNSFDGFYTDSDLGSIFLGILSDRYHLNGPSLSAAFSCYNKYYTRRLTQSPVLFEGIDLDANTPPSLRFPFYAKAPQSSYGYLGNTILSEEAFHELLPTFKRGLQKMNKPLIPLYKEYLNLGKFPLATKNILLLEEIHKAPQATLEGFIYNGVFTPLIITDTNFDRRHYIDSFTLPTVYDDEIQQKLFEQAGQDVKDVGLDNTFCNLEYWITNDGPALIEINARSATCFYWLYQQAYGFDVFRAGLELSLGTIPEPLKPLKQSTGQFNVLTSREGKSAELMDHQLLDKSPYRFLRTTKPETEIKQLSEHGAVLAQLEITGKDRKEIQAKADSFRAKLLSK
jgi:hypothetical protein